MAGPQPTNCPDLKVEAAQNRLVLNSSNTAIGAAVNVTCAVEGSSLVGESQLICEPSGTWSSALPTCSQGDELSDREIVIIAASCAVIFFVVLVLIIIVIFYYRAKAKNRQQRNDRLAATLERLSIRDPLDELVRRESRRSSYNNPAFTSSSGDDNDTEKRLEVPVALPGRGGVQLSRQTLSTWHYPPPNRVPSKSVYGASTLKHRESSNGIRLLY